MNGKRVRMAVMSAVILSALAVSGCSSEESVSYNESGEKADDVSASLSTPVKYSLQGTTQGNGLTGGAPPVRFSM